MRGPRVLRCLDLVRQSGLRAGLALLAFDLQPGGAQAAAPAFKWPGPWRMPQHAGFRMANARGNSQIPHPCTAAIVIFAVDMALLRFYRLGLRFYWMLACLQPGEIKLSLSHV